ncbi:LapA family protein [Nostoc sp. TCL26-01]|uniref:LapA family protein n=1 Tax=Nostoc sp. TCL26-01 TaxID=2576904 RepID=UPI0015C0ED9F|nr:LapA family protein [Nostoc sp. TCL26-01]QLE57788.1 LapA family protein [Nostoc sp. TCL26-01]
MPLIRLILLVAVMGGLTLLLVQNWSPVISLVFLGMRSQPLPLALWILFSTAAGAGTSLLITSLFKLSNYFGGQPRPAPFKSTTTSRRATTTRQTASTPPPSSQSPVREQDESNSDEFDDWETNTGANDDWDFAQKPQEAANPNSPAQSVRDSTVYERQQQPKSSSQSGSTYSYSYREPKNTAAGKTESVYDADYRVIIPPYQPPANEVANDEDDWGFDDDDDDFEDERPRK